jgi:hypothetical protein
MYVIYTYIFKYPHAHMSDVCALVKCMCDAIYYPQSLGVHLYWPQKLLHAGRSIILVKFCLTNQVTVVCRFFHKKCNATLITPWLRISIGHLVSLHEPNSHFQVTVCILNHCNWTFLFLCKFNITLNIHNKFSLQSPKHRATLQTEIMWVTEMHTTHTAKWKYN